MERNSTISIVIRSYNEQKYLPRLLEKIKRQNCESEPEVILVDSGSTDDTLKIAKQHNCRIIHVRKEDFSFGKSLNEGCKAAHGEFIVFISAHCIPYDFNWLNQLVAPLKDHQNLALSYGRQVGNEVTKFSEHRVFAKYYPDHDKIPQEDFFCNNANACIRKSLWESRKYNERLTGLEDLDWAKHFYNQGYKIAYASKAAVYHIHEESWRKIKLRYERESYALQEIMPEIHISFFDFLRYFFASVLYDFSFGIKERSLLKNFRQIVYFRFSQYYGSYSGNHLHRKLSKKKKEKYFYP